MEVKKDHLDGIDELNLTEVPFTLLTDRVEEGQKTLEFTDRQQGITRHWTITGSDKYGLPCAMDEPVFIAMLALTQREGFKSQKVFFNPCEVLKLMRWSDYGKHYDRLKLAMKRLKGVTIYTDYLWSNGEFKKCEMGFNIIDYYEIHEGRKGIRNSFFEWSNTVFESLSQGNLKYLDLEKYFSLKTPISRRFFRLYDKRQYKKDRISFDLMDLAHEKLGISRNYVYPSQIRQKLDPTLNEHKAKNLLSSHSYSKSKAGHWLLRIEKYRAPLEELSTKPLSRSASTDPQPLSPLEEELIKVGISRKVAKDLCNSFDPQLIRDQIDSISFRSNVNNKPAFLIDAIRENYPLPIEFKRCQSLREDQKKNDEMEWKSEYDKFILDRVNDYLQSLSPDQVKNDIDEYWTNDYLPALPDWYRKEWSEEFLRKSCEVNYKFSLGERLNLPSFEEWKSKITV